MLPRVTIMRQHMNVLVYKRLLSTIGVNHGRTSPTEFGVRGTLMEIVPPDFVISKFQTPDCLHSMQ